MSFSTKPFMVPPPGRVWVEVDLSQIEVRTLAALSRDEVMITHLNDPTFDPHCMSGAFLMGMNYSTFRANFLLGISSFVDARRQGKTISFEFQYGASARNIAKRNKLKEEDVLTYEKNYTDTYKHVVAFHEDNIKQVNTSHGQLRIIVQRDGAAEVYPRWWKIQLDKYGRYSRNQIMNYPIQGVAYDVNKLAWIQEMPDMIWKHRQVHDSILFSVPENKQGECIQLIKENYDTLQSRVSKYLFDCPVALPYEYKVGTDLSFKS